MEPTKVASSQSTQPAHATRAKSSSHPATAETGDPTAGGGFLALLAALGGGGDGNVLGEGSGDTPLSSAGNCVEVASSSTADAAALAAWQGLLDPTQNQNEPGAVYGQSALVASQSANSFSGSIATVAQSSTQGLAVSPGNALNDLLLGGIPQGLVAETAKLDTSADLKEQPSQGTLGGFGRAFSRMQAANAQRVIGMGGGGGLLRSSRLEGCDRAGKYGAWIVFCTVGLHRRAGFDGCTCRNHDGAFGCCSVKFRCRHRGGSTARR